ncbi:nucleoside deaminase, partial [uncultured Marinobacter sp.]|uniref:nucleoside deaminase n=1 Tax=uncultured Marinobacter sp. TaxID=187379 RepID=UPI0025CF4C12
MSEPRSDDTDHAFLQEAVQLALDSVDQGGAPFGAVVVHNGRVIARAGNRAKQDCDATAHAEVAAIRLAGQALGDAHMPEATLYASCEPCPMCLAAAHWARIPRIV